MSGCFSNAITPNLCCECKQIVCMYLYDCVSNLVHLGLERSVFFALTVLFSLDQEMPPRKLLSSVSRRLAVTLVSSPTVVLLCLVPFSWKLSQEPLFRCAHIFVAESTLVLTVQNCSIIISLPRLIQAKFSQTAANSSFLP